MTLDSNNILKIKKVKSYKIIIYKVSDVFTQLFVLDENEKILKTKSYALSRTSSVKKKINKNILRDFKLCLNVIWKKIPITMDDWDFICLKNS